MEETRHVSPVPYGYPDIAVTPSEMGSTGLRFGRRAFDLALSGNISRWTGIAGVWVHKDAVRAGGWGPCALKYKLRQRSHDMIDGAGRQTQGTR